jgi:hypothetical protein
MKIDVTTIFFNSVIPEATATPPWCVSIGQSKDKKINTSLSGLQDILDGLIYKSIQDRSYTDLSAGSKNNEYLLLSKFDKIFVNGSYINDLHMIVALVREHTKSHEGRLRISLPPYAKFDNGDYSFSNEETYQAISDFLGCGSLNDGGCWFMDDISVHNQDELHFSCIIVNHNEKMVYKTSQLRSSEWQDLIPEEHNYKPHPISKIPHIALQQIIFGAPGTGKSFSIKSDPDITEDNTIRTTFHPDSDYSTFVGCYKPTKKVTNKKPLIAAGDLIEKAASISGVANQVQFLCDNAESIIFAADEIGVSTNKLIWDSFKWHNETYFVSILNSILDERKLNATDEITYNFCPQAFTNAYIKAWKNPDTPIFLIIEEINRGNCAQIFGDIFQLLDRDENGFSRYDIAPDSDLQNYLHKAFEDTDIENESIKSGASMQLPPNLHIWATMNTSDQSLFPIDSAFKRRWDWKYIPIDYTDRRHYISCNGKKYSWAKFLEQINQNIEGVTQSEDKKLGYWFTGNSASQLEITADKFVSKVVFFLWNDVFKDFGHNGKTIFKDDFSKFHMFFDFTGKVKEDVLEKFLKSLELTPNDATDKADSEETETAE